MGPDRKTHVRNIAIIVLLAVVVWQVPGGDRAGSTIANVISIIFVGGQSLDLTRREFELLQLLSDAAGQVLQREEIYQRVWGYAMAHGDRSVDVFVRKLRQKLERVSPDWRYIHTHFGIGYRFDPEHVDGPGGAVGAAPAVTAAPAEPSAVREPVHA